MSKVFTKQTETNVMLYGAIIAVVCLLSYTFVHTGAVLARYIHPWGFGYICAFGIEMIVALISYKLSILRKWQTWRTLTLLFILIAALCVSAVANVYEGYYIKYGVELSRENIGEIDKIQAFVGLTATGLISLLVFAVSEIIGNDADTIAKLNTREQRKVEQAEQKPSTVQTNSEPVQTPVLTDYRDAVFSYLNTAYTNGNTPNSIDKIPVRQTAEIVGCSPATASKHIKRWWGRG